MKSVRHLSFCFFSLLVFTFSISAVADQKNQFSKEMGFYCSSQKTKKHFRVSPANGEIFEFDEKENYLSHVDLLDVTYKRYNDSKLVIRFSDPENDQPEAVILLHKDEIKMWFRYDQDSTIRCRKIRISEI